MSSELEDWQILRAREFPFLSTHAYLDYGLRGLVPTCAVESTQVALVDCRTGRAARPDQERGLARLRAALLELLGLGSGYGVCLSANCTTSIALLAGSLPWQGGERILVHEDEAASNLGPWRAVAQAHGLELEVLPSRDGLLDLDDLAAACERPVAWASFAAVTLRTGDRRPLAEISRLVRAAGGRLCVDAAQALGALPLEGGLADAWIGCGRKWLLGPPELGFLILSDEVAGTLRALSAGGRSPATGAELLEGGLPPLVPAIGLQASLELLAELGWEEIYARREERAGWLQGLAAEAGWSPAWSLPPERQGPLLHYAAADAAPHLEERLEEAGVYARVLAGNLRVSPHAWTERSELTRLIAAVEELGGL